MSQTVASILQILDFFKNNNRWLFHLGPIYGANLLNLNDFMPTFELIACNDPYFGTLPFVKVPESFKKDHKKCILGADCQNALLKDPEVIAYMKSKDPNPNIVVLMMDYETEELCKKNGLTLWGARDQVYRYLGSKINILELAEKAGVPFVPNVRSKINSYQHLLTLTDKFNTKNIVVQVDDGCGGHGTIKIDNQQDYRSHQAELENGKLFKIMGFKQLKCFTIDAVATKSGTIVGPILGDLIGHKQLLPYWAGYCGNQIRKSYFEDAEVQKKVREQIFKYTEQFGNFLYREGLFKGFFGFDFAVDAETYEVYFLEMNPRLTGTMSVELQIYEAQGYQLPIFLYHCLEYLGVEINMDINKLNQEWKSQQHYQKNELSYFVTRPMNANEESIPYDFPAGFWKEEAGAWKHTGKVDFRLKNLSEGEIFYTPNRGFSKGNIAFWGLCRDMKGNLTQRSKEIIKAFADIRLKGKA